MPLKHAATRAAGLRAQYREHHAADHVLQRECLDLLALNLGDIRGNGLERTGVDNADLVRASASISLSMYRMTSNDI